MSDPKCTFCGRTVSGYAHTNQYQFIDGNRALPLRVLRLDCGCEFFDPKYRYNQRTGEVKVVDHYGTGHEIIRWHESKSAGSERAID